MRNTVGVSIYIYGPNKVLIDKRLFCISGSQTGGHAPPPQGAMGLLPGSHGRILKKYIFQGLILKFGLSEFLTH